VRALRIWTSVNMWGPEIRFGPVTCVPVATRGVGFHNLVTASDLQRHSWPRPFSGPFVFVDQPARSKDAKDDCILTGTSRTSRCGPVA